MTQHASTTFRSRFGLMVSLLGMAVGTGNIWRFPRVMASNGGGAFLIPWLLFLFLWSIPLLIFEFSLGKKIRKGVAASFSQLTQGKSAWLGAFVVFCTLGIMFYYSVVTGWCLRYFWNSLTGTLLTQESKTYWDQFHSSVSGPLFFHALSLGLTIWVIARGIQKGIEAVNSWMIPLLFGMLIFLAGYCLTLPGSSQGLAFIFSTDFSRLLDYKVWLEGLTQSAWSTGAGWGIALTYACHARSQDDEVLTCTTTGLGNNSVELIAGMAILPALFSFFPSGEVLNLTKSGNTGLTFIVLPNVFQQMPLGRIAAILFFTSLFFAAFTSLFAMFEVGVSFFTDLGMTRRRSIVLVGSLGFLMGVPSAVNSQFFDNQDWVWGIGLLVNGFFFSLLAHQIGREKMFSGLIEIADPIPRKILAGILFWLVPVEFLALIAWWFYQSVTWAPKSWWHPFSSLSIGACLFQWGVLLILLGAFNGKLAAQMEKRNKMEG